AAPAPREIGELAEGEQVVGLHQRQPVLEVEALVRLHLLADPGPGVGVGAFERRHQRSLFTTAWVIDSSSSPRTSPLRHARALRAYASATSRLSSIAPVAAPRRSAPSPSGAPARVARTTSSVRAASRSGSVGVPSPR